MSMKPRIYSDSQQVLPPKVSGHLAQFFIEDLSEPSTKEAHVLRNILQKRNLRKWHARHRNQEISYMSAEVAASIESDNTTRASGTKK